MANDRRQFTRLPIPRDQSQTLLRAGLRQFTVHILDVSPHGIAVTCPERLEVCRGDNFQLRATEGWYEVRVVRIEPLDEGRFPIEFDCFLGLERLRFLGYGPDHNWMAGVGVRRAFLILAAAILAGLMVGSAFLPYSQGAWQHIQSLANSVMPAGW